MPSRDDIQASLDLANKATEGPWERRDYEFYGAVVNADGFEIAHVALAGDLDFIANARTAVPEMAEALLRVLELHVAWTGEGDELAFCVHCPEMWPCPTVRAITAALAGKVREG